MKRIISLFLALLVVVSIVSVFPTSASAKTNDYEYRYTYYRKCSSNCKTLVAGLKSIGADFRNENRFKIAQLNGKTFGPLKFDESGMLRLLKQGKLIKSVTKGYWRKVYLPRCSQSYKNLEAALKSVGSRYDYKYRRDVLAKANSIPGYQGYTWQNNLMLEQLKKGKLLQSKEWKSVSYTCAK